jgi:hypothetical protein
MPAGRFAFPGLSGRVAFVKRRASTHSGGTAPDSDRTSLLCPWWAPKAEEELYHKPSHKSQVRALCTRVPRRSLLLRPRASSRARHRRATLQAGRQLRQAMFR